MPSVTARPSARRGNIIGVDTHKDTHVAVALSGAGARLGELHVPTTRMGIAELHAWAKGLGPVAAWGVEGTASYGAGLTRALLADGETVQEINRPDRHARRTLGGKTDAIDAEAAARTVLAGRPAIIPKTGDGRVEMLRHVRMSRSSAVKAKTVAMNQLKATLVTAPTDLRDRLSALSARALITACETLTVTTELTIDNTVAVTLHNLATRWRHLHNEATAAHQLLTRIIRAHAPQLLELHGVGPDTAAALLITAGDNPHRLRTEASFAALCGVNPIPASSGKTDRHRLNRGGDRQANAALHRIIVVRLARHQETRTYMASRRTPNRSNTMHLIRTLKRYLARQLYPLILATTNSHTTP